MRRILTAMALMAGVLTVVAPAAAHEDDILHFFDDVVFAGKLGGRVVKWTRAPTVRLETIARASATGEGRAVDNDPRLYAALVDHVAAIAEASELNMRVLPDGIDKGGDIVVTLVPLTLFPTLSFDGVPRKVLREQMGPGRCFFLIWPNQDRSIAKAHVVINSILSEDHIKHCFYEEIVQSLGLPNDSDRLRPSIFNEQMMLSGLSDLDRRLIRALYDPAITPGLGRLDALERAAVILHRDR